MKGKELRQSRIRELLQDSDLETHEMLAAALRRRGIEVSQSTLSKDLRELGVVRLPRPEGGFRYGVPEAGAAPRDLHLLERELCDYQVQAVRARNLVVVKTLAGHAQSLCAAIDRMDWGEIVGTLAGEDTILIIAPTDQEAEGLLKRLRQLSGD
ncbi:MAG: arginine repressor [Candidatus Handelsmanbacteria bacterium]|nr:arginine repressor [Candidatus Handelsmanbacteria bacterium]